MKIKHILALLALIFSLGSNAQIVQKDISLRLSRDRTSIRSINMFAGNIIISISQKGEVRLNAMPGTQYSYLDPFGDRTSKLSSIDTKKVSYYEDFDSSRSGKIQSVGNIIITYNDQFDGFDNIGKVKNVGGTVIKYNDRFDGFDNTGKIKSINGIAVKYYDRFDADEINGKLKSVGNIVIKYYDRFDGADKSGFIKSITGRTPHVSIQGLTDEDLANADSGF